MARRTSTYRATIYLAMAAIVATVLAPGVLGQAQSSGVVEGTVTDAETHVRLVRVGIELRRIGETNGAPLKTTTDANGSFKLSDLAAGAYWLTAHDWGFATTYYGTDPTGPRLEIADGGVANIKLQMLRFASLQGRILGANGQSKSGASVILNVIQKDSAKTILIPSRRTTSDAHGQYRFDAVPAGDYQLSAVLRSTAAGQSAQAYTYSPGPLHLTGAKSVIVADLKLEETAGYAASGKINDSAGSNLAGLAVHAWRTSGNGKVLDADSSVVKTDAQGNFRLTNLTPGQYQIGVLGTNNGHKQSALQTVDVSKSDASVSAVVAAPGVTASGKITFQGNDPPVNPQAVRISHVSDLSIGNLARTWANIKADGTFVIDEVPLGPGHFEVLLASSRFSLTSIVLNGKDVTNKAVDANSGGPQTLEIVVQCKPRQNAGK